MYNRRMSRKQNTKYANSNPKKKTEKLLWRKDDFDSCFACTIIKLRGRRIMTLSSCLASKITTYIILPGNWHLHDNVKTQEFQMYF